MSTATEQFDRLIDVLGQRMQQTPGGGDAIDEVLASPGRKTAVQSLSNHPDVVQFRQELVDGLIRVDTVHRLVELLSVVLPAILAR